MDSPPDYRPAIRTVLAGVAVLLLLAAVVIFLGAALGWWPEWKPAGS